MAAYFDRHICLNNYKYMQELLLLSELHSYKYKKYNNSTKYVSGYISIFKETSRLGFLSATPHRFFVRNSVETFIYNKGQTRYSILLDVNVSSSRV
jgi:hypothetical protein